jgi:hypothetical protein
MCGMAGRGGGVGVGGEGLDQREGRQREEENVTDWPSLLERTLIFGWRGNFSVRHCCCVLARILGKETKMICPCYGISSNI